MLREHLQVRWASGELDRRLADGADPHADRLLELRAERLVSRATRARVATELLVTDPCSPLYTAGSSDEIARAAREAAAHLASC